MTMIKYLTAGWLHTVMFALLFLTSGASGSDQNIHITITQKGILPQEELLPLTPSAEQENLEAQLMSFAKQSPDFQTFLKNARKSVAIPNISTVDQEIWKRAERGEDAKDLSYCFTQGYLISMNRLIPADLFLRQFYDNFKMPDRGRNQSHSDEPVLQTNEHSSGQIVRITAEGEGHSRQEAERAAIREALGRVDAHWFSKTKAGSSQNDSRMSSEYSDETMVIYGGHIRQYDVVNHKRTADGKYQVVISAEIKKSSSSGAQAFKTENLNSAYIENENRENAAIKIKELLSNPPADLFNYDRKSLLLEGRSIFMSGEISIDLEKYNSWFEKIAQLSSCAGAEKSSFATLSSQLEQFFTPEKLHPGLATDHMYLCNFQKSTAKNSLLNLNNAVIFYQKYTLPERLLRQITDSFSIVPEIAVELENSKGETLTRNKISFDELGIVFIPKGEAAVKTANFGNLFLEKYPVPLLIQPFFYDKNSNKRALKFSFGVKLTLHPKLYARRPNPKISVYARPGAEAPVISHDPKLATCKEGQAKYEEGNYEEAYSIFSELARLKNTPDREIIDYYLAKLAYEWRKKTDEAIGYLKSNTRTEAIALLGEIYEKSNRPDEALECYRRLAGQNNTAGMVRYGTAQLKNGNTQEGIRYLEKAEKNGNLIACYYLAEYYRNEEKKFKKAIPYYQKAAEAKEEFEYYPHCLYYTARAYAYGISVKKNNDTALFYLEKIIKGQDKYSDAQYLAGVIKKDIPAKRHEAREHFRNAAKNKHFDGMFEYGCCLLAKDFNEALSYLTEAAEKNPEYYYSAGEKLFSFGEYDAAEKMLFSCTEKSSDRENQGKAFWLLSILRKGKKDFTGANRFIEKAADCDNPEAICSLAQKALRKKEFQKAQNYLNKIRENLQAILLLGDLHAEETSHCFSRKQALDLYNEAFNAAKKKADRSVERQAAERIRRLQSQSALLKN